MTLALARSQRIHLLGKPLSLVPIPSRAIDAASLDAVLRLQTTCLYLLPPGHTLSKESVDLILNKRIEGKAI
eukprot:3763289-Amphidinium_carterae.1